MFHLLKTKMKNVLLKLQPSHHIKVLLTLDYIASEKHSSLCESEGPARRLYFGTTFVLLGVFLGGFICFSVSDVQI